MSPSHPVVIVGAGVGGLSAAIRLASRGRAVTVLEQNAQVGGKLNETVAAGFRWDTGPSVITLRPVFEELFAAAGRQMADYIELLPIDPLTRYFYPDGAVLDIRRALAPTLEAIQRIAPRDVEGYLGFLAYAARLQRITAPVFTFGPKPGLADFLRVPLGDALQVDAWRTMQAAIEGHVRSPHLRQFLGRFATYTGSSPYLAPATLSVIAHVELNEGVWYPRGGVYAIARALQRLAGELGVEIRTGAEAQRLRHAGRAVSGVELAGGEFVPAAAVIANLDAALVYRRLLDGAAGSLRQAERLERRPASCSGYILLLGVEGAHPQLAHHNIFFSPDYRQEFAQIFPRDERRARPPDEPTIYVAITSKSDPAHAPPGCENWFVLVNAPPAGPGFDWEREEPAYRQRVLQRLAGFGLPLDRKIRVQRAYTPLDLERLSGARRGALYGMSFNDRLAPFRRPGSRAAGFDNLFLAGGTVHPGGGVPLAMISGRLAAEAVEQFSP